MNEVYAQLDGMCLAKFASHCYKHYYSKEENNNDNQPVVLSDDVVENQHGDYSRFPNKIKLMTRKETMKCRKVQAIIGFHTPSKTTEPEKYFHHLLMLYFNWRKESDLIGDDNIYLSKFEDPSVKEIV